MIKGDEKKVIRKNIWLNYLKEYLVVGILAESAQYLEKTELSDHFYEIFYGMFAPKVHVLYGC